MSGVIPNEGEVVVLEKYVEVEDLTLKLFSNDVTPGESDTNATYTEVAGGGYAAKTLSLASWTIVAGAPSTASYAAQDFTFTGATTALSTIYGYYIVDGSNILRGAERFGSAVVPFTPVLGSLIRITPKLQVS